MIVWPLEHVKATQSPPTRPLALWRVRRSAKLECGHESRKTGLSQRAGLRAVDDSHRAGCMKGSTTICFLSPW